MAGLAQRTRRPCLPPVAVELYHGNILLLAAAIALGMRYRAWACVPLTKVTRGVGLVLFAVRWEWRRLSLALPVLWFSGLAILAAIPAVERLRRREIS